MFIRPAIWPYLLPDILPSHGVVLQSLKVVKEGGVGVWVAVSQVAAVSSMGELLTAGGGEGGRELGGSYWGNS